MQPSDPASRKEILRRYGPIVIGAIAFLLYLFTLTRWITHDTLALTARVEGVSWRNILPFPLTHLLTYPIRWLPGPSQPFALNALTAALASITLFSLARTILLIPQTKTKEQRIRTRSSAGLLEGPLAWLPVVTGVTVLGFQLTFWENATGFTGEIINLLPFALAIQALAEYQNRPEDRFLFLGTFAYAIGMTNNWAMLGFAPFYLVALIALKRARFFDFQFLSRLTLYGLVGLALYLVIPALIASQPEYGSTFWEAALAQFGSQKNHVLSRPHRVPALVLSLATIVPALFLTIRWPASFGDASRTGILFTNALFHIVHAAFLLACLFIALDLPYSPRAIGQQVPGASVSFLSFSYLAAIAVGYYVGYFALLITCPAEHPSRSARKKRNPAFTYVGGAALVALALGTPIALFAKNFPLVSSKNKSIAKDIAVTTAQALPDERSVVLSDHVDISHFAAIAQREVNPEIDHIWIPTSEILSPSFYVAMARKYPDIWQGIRIDTKDSPTQSVGILEYAQGLGETDDPMPQFVAIEALIKLSETYPVYYLHPSVGFFFEEFYAIPRGPILELERLSRDGDLTLPPNIPADALNATDAFWAENGPQWADQLEALSRVKWPVADSDHSGAARLGNSLSKITNGLGYIQQLEENLDSAQRLFALAQRFSDENQCAANNLEVNRFLRSEIQKIPEPASSLREYALQYIDTFGMIDHPILNIEVAMALQKNGQRNQASFLLDRAVELMPDNPSIHIERVSHFLRNYSDPKWARERFEEMRAQFPPDPALAGQELAIGRMLAWIQFLEDGRATTRAVDTLNSLATAYPESPTPLRALAEIYLEAGDLDACVSTLDRQLAKFPESQSTIIMQSGVLLMQDQFEKVIAKLEPLLEADAANRDALINMGLALIATEKWERAKEVYNTILQLDSGYTEAYLQLARIAKNQGETREARGRYREFLKSEPEGSPLHERAASELESL